MPFSYEPEEGSFASMLSRDVLMNAKFSTSINVSSIEHCYESSLTSTITNTNDVPKKRLSTTNSLDHSTKAAKCNSTKPRKRRRCKYLSKKNIYVMLSTGIIALLYQLKNS